MYEREQVINAVKARTPIPLEPRPLCPAFGPAEYDGTPAAARAAMRKTEKKREHVQNSEIRNMSPDKGEKKKGDTEKTGDTIQFQEKLDHVPHVPRRESGWQ